MTSPDSIKHTAEAEWKVEPFVDNRKQGGEHHTYRITPQRGVYGSMFEEDAVLAAAAPKLLEAIRPFARLAAVITGEAPHEADWVGLFTDCQGQSHRITMNELRAACAAVSKAKGRIHQPATAKEGA